MSKKLFNDFKSVSSKEWKQKIQVDLKGADYNKTLIWQTNEGINVKPFYHADEFSNDFNTISNPESWTISQSIFVHDTQLSNKKAIDAISRGAESIKFVIQNSSVSIEELLLNIDRDKTVVFFETARSFAIFLNSVKVLYAMNSPCL